MREITRRQEEILDFLKDFIEEHRYPPTIREVADFFSISVKGAYDHIKALEKKKIISCNNKQSRTIEILGDKRRDDDFISVPILGHVAAGTPLLAEANWDGELQFSASLLGRGTHFILRVQGDSMVDAGIFDGDMAVFVQKQQANNGDIIVAMVEDAVTLKRFYKEKNRVCLKAENQNYPPLYTRNIKILGKLVTLVRSYG